MDNDKAMELGRRWREAKGDMDQPGMAWTKAGGFHSPVRVTDDDEPPEVQDRSEWVIDLRDPATRGAALAVVRERWGKPRLHASPSGLHAWYVGDGICTIVPGAATEAEALVSALEAVPEAAPAPHAR